LIKENSSVNKKLIIVINDILLVNIKGINIIKK